MCKITESQWQSSLYCTLGSVLRTFVLGIERIVRASSMSKAELNDALLWTHLPAGALMAYAPPLGEVIFDFARDIWEDIVKAAETVGSVFDTIAYILSKLRSYFYIHISA